MIGDDGAIDYAEVGDGPTVVLVPGSCSTGSAWKPLISAWGGGWRFVTTSLPGYGGTRERRTGTNASMAHVADVVEAVIQKAGAGTFASWPQRARDYAIETTRVNRLDWSSAHGFALRHDDLARISAPTLVLCGSDSPRAMQRIVARLGAEIPGAGTETIDHAAHFMIATHAAEVAARLRRHIARAAETDCPSVAER